MDSEYKKQIAFRILTRAETSIYFVEDFLYHYNAKDGVFFRSICILLSYGFELALKSRFVFLSKSKDKLELEKELKNLNHDVLKIADSLGVEELNKIGINDITGRNTSSFLGYVIKISEDKEISIENFTDIRYDFLNDGLRNLEEHETIKMYIEEILKIIGQIKKLNI
jgi:hypothetical protein